MSSDDLPVLVSHFAEAARIHAHGVRTGGDVVVTNRAADQVSGAARLLLALGKPGIDAVGALTRDEDDEVALWAAAYLLAHNARPAKRRLRQIARSGTPLLSLSAEITLHEWKRGRLRMP